ncbi:NHL domain-containing protein [Rhynchospora pubera]|uniref:NHL domain-containing protein n=1 Tax=Rhynchospora pubera TaxID=906938 RepID=A0AAV8G6D5_9POAL|nr:NHL domain-containing protein [Rhynchospora pubera]
MASLLLGSLLIVALSINSVSSKVVLEEGYTVSTIIDFNKISSLPASGVHPYAIVPLLSSQNLVLLDHTGSTFYTLSFPSLDNKEVAIEHLSGNGKAGFLDGDAKVASFSNPKSFAVDAAGNVYVADAINHVIRKITPSGFTVTIAGGNSRKTGNADGPAQNASFSNNFELVYMHKKCALVVVDRANNLIRQIDLNSKDCLRASPKSGLGAALVSVIAIASLLLGSVIGFVARPFLNFHGLVANCHLSMTLKRYQTNQGRTTLMSFSGVRSAVANTAVYFCLVRMIKYTIGFLSVVVRTLSPKIVVTSPPESGSISLMDLDVVPVTTFPDKNDFLKDLMCLDTVVTNSFCKQGEVIDAPHKGGSVTQENKLDEMILTHMSDFSCQATQQGVLEESNMSGSSLVRRRSLVKN